MSIEATQDGKSWEDSIPATQDALDLLQTAADDLARSRTIDHDERAEATATAIGLVASLSSFGLNEAAGLAQHVVDTLQHPGLPQPERLQQQVAALRGELSGALDE